MLSPALTALERRWHEEIPLSAAMGLKIVDGDDGALTLRAPLEPNRNVHGTGFAGSLYAQPAYECHKQKSLGMLYYGTTVQMCVTERVAERVGTVQAFLDRQMRGM